MKSTKANGTECGRLMTTAVFLMLGALILLPACGDDEVKPNRDSIITTNALATVKEMFSNYRGREFDLMGSHFSPAFKSFRPDTKFRSAKHEYEVQRVRIVDDSVQIVLGWQGTWKLKSGEIASGGQCTMFFSAGTGKLTGLEGDNPFAIPGRRVNE